MSKDAEVNVFNELSKEELRKEHRRDLKKVYQQVMICSSCKLPFGVDCKYPDRMEKYCPIKFCGK